MKGTQKGEDELTADVCQTATAISSGRDQSLVVSAGRDVRLTELRITLWKTECKKKVPLYELLKAKSVKCHFFLFYHVLILMIYLVRRNYLLNKQWW